MKINETTILVGPRTVLVPYRSEHVPRYHLWMQDEQLRDLTASEPLTLDEEYDMQKKWQEDEDKLTFIVLAREGQPATIASQANIAPDTLASIATSSPMVGDVNVFFNGRPPSAAASEDESDDEFAAELEIMIAEPEYRRSGFALEALQLMLEYITGFSREVFVPQPPSDIPDLPADQPRISVVVPPKSLVTRISSTNTPSINLFKKLGFVVVKTVEVFNEVEMRYRRDTAKEHE